LKKLGEFVTFERIPNINKLITEWTEKELFSGNDFESLLILASLNLETYPIEYEA